MPTGQTSSSQDERIMAALAHASAILPMWGLIVAIVIWATQKDKSQFVRFQALQATVYHLVAVVGMFTLGACYMCSVFTFPLGMLASPSSQGQSGGDVSPLFFLPLAVPFAVMGISFLGWLGFVIYGVVAAAKTLRGRDFHYIVIGRRLESYLVQEEHPAA